MAKKKSKRAGAKKAAPKKTRGKKKPAAKRRSAPKRARSAPSTQDGPVTLEQARALARARTPRRALSKAAAESVSVPAATPGTVGAERVRLARAQRQENDQRMREYKAVMTIMKQRGAKASKPRKKRASKKRASKGRARAAKQERVIQPLQVFAEGDSWFDYPVYFFGGGIIPRLEKRLGVPILNLAKAGDEVRYMLGVDQRKKLARQLKDGCPAGGPWDVLLFSGGGNDIVDNPMALWIRRYDPSLPPASLLHQSRFEAALALVRAGYEDLIEMRNKLSPSTQLVFHAYDYAIPDGRGICHLGPWLKPTFDLRKFPKRKPAFEVVKLMLQQFAATLESLEMHKGVIVINGQGTLTPKPKSWHNELHPSKDGFKKFAKLFYKQLKAQFPGRVV